MTHLDLETCKALKVAGYPQTDSTGRLLPEYGYYAAVSSDYTYAGPLQAAEAVYHDLGLLAACPTSDELLEALESQLPDPADASIILTRDWHSTRWIADVEHADWSKNFSKETYASLWQDTPAEALAALWLALNASKE